VPKAIGADKKRETKTLAQAVGAELTDLRRSKKLSQQKLADRLGYDVSHVRQTEMGGNPTLEFLNAVATFFSLKLSDFIDRAEKLRVPPTQ
jgi:transcriptional regulator with XRE-family HTH domain